MPTYQYLCTDCGHEFEVVQSFSDDAITSCEKCQGVVRKVYNSVGIVFKGSGFYKTDSRTTASASKEKSSTSTVSDSAGVGGSSSSGTGGSGTSTNSD